VIEGIVDEKASPFRAIWLHSRKGEEIERSEGFSVRNRPFRLDRIELWAQRERETFKSEQTTVFPVRGFTVRRDAEKKQTIVEIESGGEPLNKLAMTTPDRNFSRPATVEVEKEVYGNTKWVEIGSGTLSAIEYLDFKKESLAIPVPEHRARKYRLIIRDEDNAPIAIESISGEGRIYQVVFLAKPSTEFQVYYGSAKAESPHYDIATVLAPIRHTYKPVLASLGPESANPAYDVKEDKPRSRLLENKLFLAAAIAAMVAILAWALFSTSRKLGD
jgi:hypothetical protein